MRTIPTCTLQAARRATLRHQGLLKGAYFGQGKQAVVRAIGALGYLQIDTISVVDRSHHHILKTRISNYTPELLTQLQAVDRQVFEYWSHAAAYLPIQDYRYYLPMMHGFGAQRSHDKALTQAILQRIAGEGPLQSKDFEQQRDRQSNGWWDWKPAKHALEYLFLSGQLMINERRGFAKVYDLTERILPSWIDTRMPSVTEWARFSLLKSLKAMGIGTLADLTYARATVRRFTAPDFLPDYAAALQQLLDEGEACAVDVEGETWYALPGLFEPTRTQLDHSQVQCLSPFDNLVINRKRILRLFNFDYQLECYVPAAKRRYGYFCLPLLWGDQLLGRMDCKAERKTGVLRIRHLQIESQHVLTDALISALERGIQRLAEGLLCTRIAVETTTPAQLRQAIKLQSSH
ncbi:winged helix DNA-binding domain-containing protein [Pseudomonadales bacterium]|nr:winged helix DNA-binding domain-containing protein [Pseudomonadales bacterium]